MVNAHALPALLVFLEVVRAGSLTRAAKRLNTVPSNVTARRKLLEGTLGARGRSGAAASASTAAGYDG